MVVTDGLAGPERSRVDIALEGRVQAVVPIELQPPVDVLEQTPNPRDHHVPGAELRLRVTGLEDPGSHHPRLAIARRPPAASASERNARK